MDFPIRILGRWSHKNDPKWRRGWCQLPDIVGIWTSQNGDLTIILFMINMIGGICAEMNRGWGIVCESHGIWGVPGGVGVSSSENMDERFKTAAAECCLQKHHWCHSWVGIVFNMQMCSLVDVAVEQPPQFVLLSPLTVKLPYGVQMQQILFAQLLEGVQVMLHLELHVPLLFFSNSRHFSRIHGSLWFVNRVLLKKL